VVEAGVGVLVEDRLGTEEPLVPGNTHGEVPNRERNVREWWELRRRVSPYARETTTATTCAQSAQFAACRRHVARSGWDDVVGERTDSDRRRRPRTRPQPSEGRVAHATYVLRVRAVEETGPVMGP
jgi:hypothetical protein